MKPVLFVLLALVSTARANDLPWVEFSKRGCALRARAYLVPKLNPKIASRFDLELIPPRGQEDKWEFTLPPNERHGQTNIVREVALTPFGSAKQTTIGATLRQFDFLDERITFRNLPLALPPTTAFRHLELSQARTQTTPSGITVTLPAQGADAVPMDFNGNAQAVFLKIKVSPSTRLSRLPNSPLFRKYGKNAHIKLDVAAPDFSVYSEADNTFDTLAVAIPHLDSATKLDLKLVVRQKVELQSFPLALNVPVGRAN